LIVTIAVASATHQNAQAQSSVDLPLDALLSTKISTAAKYDQQMSEIAASVTVISSEEIERYGWTTFDELLSAIRGLYITNDREYSSLGVRGISRPTDSNSRLLLLIDGNPLVGTVFGEVPTGNSFGIDLHAIERVEFVRGPASALYGTGAMFGVLNVITRKAGELDGGGANIVAGSGGRFEAGVQFGKAFASGVAVAANVNWHESNGRNLYYPEFDAPETNHGVAKGRDFENFASAMATLTWGPLKVWGRTQTRQKGVPTGSYGTTFNELSQTTNRSQIAGADYMQGLGSNKQFAVRGYWLRTTAAGLWPYDDLGKDHSSGLRYGAEGTFRWDIKANQRLVIGSELSKAPIAQYTYVVGDYEVAFQRPFSLASIYVQHEYQPFKRVSVVAGIRHDKYSHAKGSTNPRMAVIVTPTAKTAFKLLYGSAFRIPSMYELEYEDQVWGAKKNENLAPERVRSLEAVVEQRLSRDTFAVFSVYKINASHLIEPLVDPADSLVQFQNAGAANGHGFEVEMNMRRKDGLWAYSSYSWQRVTEGGVWMSNSPQHLLKGGISTNPWARFHGGVEVSYESGRRTLQDTVTNPATLVHATVSAGIARHARLKLSARNLFDVDYANAVGPEFRQASIRQDGRTVSLTLSFLP
jgi:iron complex outermembrane receptor protein